MALVYEPGATGTPGTHNFISSFDALKPDKDDVEYLRYGSDRLSGLVEIFGDKKAATNLTYSHFERDRIMPKIKATNGGAGAAGAAVVFDLAAAADYSISTQSPYQGSTTVKGGPVLVNDLIQIKPASGTVVSSGSYIECIVSAVNMSAGSNGQFTAIPLNSADAIPSIATADEIIIYGNAFGEGSTIPESRMPKTTEYSNNIQIIKNTYEITHIASCEQRWYRDTDTGSQYYTLDEEQATNTMFMNYRELNYLINPGFNNATIANTFGAAGTPLSMTTGVIPTILDRGNITNYSSITGITLPDFEAMSVTLDSQKGAKNNFLFCGIELSILVDREFRDVLKNGAITYGNFRADEQKSINLGFSKFEVGGYTYQKKTLAALNDAQTTGANGYGYAFEGMVIPMEHTVDGKNQKVPPMRMRYLMEEGKRSAEMKVTPVNLEEVGDTGRDVSQVRYKSCTGIELFAVNRMVYIRRS